MKSLCHILYIFILCQYIYVNEAQIAFLYRHSGMRGGKIRVRLDKCRNLPYDWACRVRSVDTLDNCARLFSGTNCNGEFIEILPNSPSTRELGHWGFTDITRSVGPCRNGCSTDVTGYIPARSFQVQVYTNEVYQGLCRNISINGCTAIPENYIEQIKSVNANGHCIQFYDNNQCETGSMYFDRNSIELRAGTPFHSHFDRWNFPRACAVSHCAYKCNSQTYCNPVYQCFRMKTKGSLTAENTTVEANNTQDVNNLEI